MTCTQCRHQWCWICGGLWSDIALHKITAINYINCVSIGFAPDTRCKMFLFLLLCYCIIIFMPIVVFFAFFGLTMEHSKLDKGYLSPKYDTGKCCKFLLICIYLPWNFILLCVHISVGLIAGAICMPIMTFPALFVNIRSFHRIMKYWSGKNRFKRLNNKSKNN